MKTLEERLDELIENCELKPKMYFANNSDFSACYSYFMYLKFDGNVSEIEQKLHKHFPNLVIGTSREYSVFLKPDFQEKIKIFRRTLENMIFE